MAVVVVVTDDKAADRTPVEGEGMVIPVSTTMSNCQPRVRIVYTMTLQTQPNSQP